MATDLRAYIKVASNASVFFTNTSQDDVILYPTSNSQKILLGNTTNTVAALTITSNNISLATNVGIGKSNPAYTLDVNGTVNFTGALTQNNVVYQASRWASNSALGVFIQSNVAIQGPASSCNQLVVYGSIGLSNQGYTFMASSNNFLGVGLSNPSQRLTVMGGMLGGTIENTAFGFDSSSNARLGIIKKSGIQPVFGTTSNSPMAFAILNSGTSIYDNIETNTLTEVMRIHTNSNVGINTTTPSEQLHVVGNIYSTSQFLNNSNDSVSAPSFAFKEDTNTGMYHASNDALGFVTGGTERVRIIDNGNVGIGTTTPTFRLHVPGNVSLANRAFFRGVYDYGATTNRRYALLATMTQNQGMARVILVGGGADSIHNAQCKVFADLYIDARNAYVKGVANNHGVINNLGTGIVVYRNTTTSDMSVYMTGGRFLAYEVEVHNIEQTTISSNITWSADTAFTAPAGTTLFYDTITHVPTDTTFTTVFATLSSVTSNLVQLNNGNTGFSTSNPVERLHVNGKILSSTQYLNNGGFNSNVPCYSFLSNSNTGMYHASNNALGFVTGGTERVRITDVGNVGINKSNPSELLHVAGKIVSDTQFLNNSVASAALPCYSFLTDSNTGMYNAAADALGFVTNGTERVRITSTGSLGIGTSSPSEQLHVVGNIYSTSQFLNNSNDSASAPAFAFKEDTNTGMYHASNDAVGFVTGGTERVRITDVGNVGIGTTNPSAMLHVQGTSVFTGSLAAGPSISGVHIGNYSAERPGIELVGNTDGIIDFTTAGVDIHGRIYYNHSTHFMSLTTNNAERFRITSTGNVGIGTTIPSNALEVVGKIATNIQFLFTGGSNSNVPCYSFLSNSNTGMYHASNNALGFVTGGTERVRITDVGNVGINKSNPSELLHVAGKIASDTQFLNNSVASAALPCYSFLTDSNTGMYNAAADALGFVTNATERVRITSTGSLGIGTSSPSEQLHVVGNIYSTSQFLNNSNDSVSAPAFAFKEDTNTGMYHASNDAVGFVTGGTERVRIIDNGNVGIGITAPTYPLHVPGNVSLANRAFFRGAYDYGTSTTNRRYALLATMTQNQGMARVIFTGGGTDSVFPVNRKTFVDLYIDARDGYVKGVVHNQGTASTSGAGIVIYNNTTTNDLSVYMTGDVFFAYSVEVQNLLQTTISSNITWSADTSFTPPAGTALMFDTATNAPPNSIFSTVYATRTTISSNFTHLVNGNVGIGLSNPTERLQVVGKVATDSQFLFTGGSNSNVPCYSFLSNSNTGMYNAALNSIGFVTNSSERVRITSTGNVGIGTITPSNTLHVNGSARVDGFLTLMGGDASSFAFPSATDASNMLQTYIAFGGLDAGTDAAFLRQIGGFNGIHLAMDFHDDGDDAGFSIRDVNTTTLPDVITTRFTVQRGGNVGIGLSNPSFPLHIRSNMMIQGTFDSSNHITHARIYFTDRNFGIGAGKFLQSTTEDNMYFWAYDGVGRDFVFSHTLDGMTNPASWRKELVIKAVTGFVGVGRSNPSELLHVAGKIASDTQFLNNSVASAALPCYSFLTDSNTGMYNAAADALGFVTNGTERVRITSTGSLGIGTSSPSEPLHVVGNIYSTSQFLNNSNDSVSAPAFAFKEDTNTGMYHASNDAVGFVTGGTERVRIIDNGNVGIGITAPTYPLHVPGNVSLANRAFFRGAHDYPSTAHATTNRRYALLATMTQNQGMARVIFTGGGAVSGNPLGRKVFADLYIDARDGYVKGVVHNQGTATTSGAGIVIYNNTTTNDLSVYMTGDAFNAYSVEVQNLLQTTISSNITWSADSVFTPPAGTALMYDTIVHTPPDSIFSTVYATRTTISSNFTHLVNGNVGIGLSNPVERLHVNGKILSETQYLNNGGSNVNMPCYSFLTNSNTGMYNAAVNSIGFVTNSNERVRINAAGQVGIGTSNPGYTLDVVGSINFTSSLFQNGVLFQAGGGGGGGWSNDTNGVTTLCNVGIKGPSTVDDELIVYGDIAMSNFGLTTFHTSNNLLGIGVSNPSYSLHLRSNMMVQGVHANNNYLSHGRIYLNDANYGIGAGRFNQDLTEDMLYLWAFDSNNRDIVFTHTSNGATDPRTWKRDMVIQGLTGNVGIGLSNPAERLQVVGKVATNTQFLFIGGSNSNVPCYSFTSSSNTGMYNAAVNSIGFVTNSSERVRITDTGNVGVGLSNPSQLFTVNGSILGGNTVDNTAFGFDAQTNARLGIIKKSGAFPTYATTSTNPMLFSIFSSATSVFDNIGTNTLKEIMRIHTNSNVGINTTAPSEQLHVSGKILSTTQFLNQGGFNSNIPCYSFLANSNTGLYNADTNALGLVTGGTERIRIASTGNVGIGTITPNAALQFSNVNANRRIVLWETANNDHQYFGFGMMSSSILRYQIGAIASSHAFYAGTGTTTSTELMRITGAGYVGIGTAAPTYPLHVATHSNNISIQAEFDIVAYSDARLKTDLEPITSALDKIERITGYTYRRIGASNTQRVAGVVSQEVREVFPEVVYENPSGIMSVAYGNMSALLIEAIKELKKEVADIKRVLQMP